MRLLIVVFFLFLSFLHPEVLFADNSTVPASKCAPLLIGSYDSIYNVPLQSTTNVPEVKTCRSVEDTILPPCDILFLKSGKIEYCKIIETTPIAISYKMCDYVEGPTIVVNKTTVQKIRYANGREEIIVAEQQAQTKPNVKPQKDRLATLSLIMGLVGIATLFLFGGILPVLAITGIVTGIISLVKIHKSKGELRGKGSAIIGIILCAIALLLLAF